jgi:hypothetical protein
MVLFISPLKLIGMKSVLWILVLGVLSADVHAQFKNILVDDAVNTNGQFPSEPTIAINFKNPALMVAGASPDNVYTSDNGGSTWRKATLSSPFGVGGDHDVIADFSGNFFYFYSSNPTGENGAKPLDRLLVQKSKNGGVSWDKTESIVNTPLKQHDKKRSVADRKGNIYVTWTQFDALGSNDAACKSVVMFSKASGGSKWSKPLRLSQFEGTCKDDGSAPRGAMPAVTNDGKVFAAWSGEGYIFLDRSFNGGETWLTNDIPVVEHPGGWQMTIPGIKSGNGMPKLAMDLSKGQYSGAMYLTWADQSSGEKDTDIWFSRSFNFGDNWTSPMRINDDDPGTHQFLPAMTVDPETGHIFIVYYDRRNYEDEQTDVYLAYSIDYGGTFKNVKISEEPFTPDADVVFGEYSNIAAYNGIITPIWTRMDNGKTSIWMSVIKLDDLEGSKPAPKKGKKKK